jgi:cytochrome b pre-mRNA-processing protein 3
MMKNFSRLFRAETPSAATALYKAVTEQARQPVFYAEHGVPDTVDGRFEMIALHMFLVLHRLKADGKDVLAQQLFDIMFADMDHSLREMGAGDLGVGRRVRAMAEGLYGRIAAYEAGIGVDDGDLTAALRRNLFGTVPDPGPSAAALGSLCRYLRTSMADLRRQATAEISAGSLQFPSPPGGV